MKITDLIYGEMEINEPVLIELIESAPLQRLKKIDQAGNSESFYPGSKHNRFEHSIGVFSLLRKYGAPLEEQIAGLIHDVSHSAFSHAVDYVLSDGSGKNQAHQDNVFNKFVRDSEIPKILEKYGYDLEYILDDDNFPLKENNLPDICADRIDYSLRTALMYKYKTQKELQGYLKNLVVKNSRWVFKDYQSARKFAEMFFFINKEYLSGITSAVMFMTLGNYLKYAMNKGYIVMDDLYTDDEVVLTKIKKFHKVDKELQKLLARTENKVKYVNDPNNYEQEVFCKSRVIDPLYLDGPEMKRVSDKDPEWSELIRQNLKPKQYFLRFLD